MIPELGHYALVLALALGLIQSVVPMIGARPRDAALMRLADFDRGRAVRLRRAFVRGADASATSRRISRWRPCSRIRIR